MFGSFASIIIEFNRIPKNNNIIKCIKSSCCYEYTLIFIKIIRKATISKNI